MTTQGSTSGTTRSPMLARLAAQDPVPPAVLAAVLWILPQVVDYVWFALARLGGTWHMDPVGPLRLGLSTLVVLGRLALVYVAVVVVAKLHAIYLELRERR